MLLWMMCAHNAHIEDSEDSLKRAYVALEEAIGFVTSFANSQRLIERHQEIVVIQSELDVVYQRFRGLLQLDEKSRVQE